MANPFRSLVGLRGVDTSASSWVNDITGMSTELVAALAQPSDIFGVVGPDADPTAQVWESVHRNAYERILSESLLMLSEKYDFQPVVARTAEPMRAKPAETRVGQFLLGTIATLPYAANTDINLRSLTVYVMPDAMPESSRFATVQVIDMDSGATLYNAQHEFQFGLNIIELNQDYRTALLEPLRLGVFVRATTMYLTELVLDDFFMNGDYCSGYTLEGCRTASIVFGPVTEEKTFISLDIEVTRSLESLLLRYTKDLRTAYGYLCASMLLLEKMASPNLNVFTLSNVTFTEKLQASLLDDFKRALRPVIRLLSNDLNKQQAITAPEPTPDQVTIRYGSFV